MINFVEVSCNRKEKRSGRKNRQVVCQKQRSSVAHCRRLPAIVSYHLLGPPRLTFYERHQQNNHHIRGEWHRQQLVYARETISADIRLPSPERPAQSVHHGERDDRLFMFGDRIDCWQHCFCF